MINVLKKYSYIIGIRAAQFRIVSRVNRRVGKRPTMDYSNVNAFVHAMIQSWKPVYKQCDFVLDTTNGRTYDFIQRIEDELDASDVQFKARRQPNDTNDVDAKEAAEDIQFNNQQSRKKEISEAVSKRAMSNKIRYDKRYKQKTSNQTNKKGKAHSISKQRTPQGGNVYEKNRNTNKRRRRTWNERRHQSANSKSNT